MAHLLSTRLYSLDTVALFRKNEKKACKRMSILSKQHFEYFFGIRNCGKRSALHGLCTVLSGTGQMFTVSYQKRTSVIRFLKSVDLIVRDSRLECPSPLSVLLA